MVGLVQEFMSQRIVLFFSGYLYHYGDRCLVDGGVIKESLRSFQYIVEKGYVEPDFPGTKKLPDRFA